MRTSNALEGEACLNTKCVESARSQYVCGVLCYNGTFNATVDISPLYIGVGLQVLPFLLFHKTFFLLQFHFSYAFANFYFKGIIRGPSTTFNFSVCFFNLRLYYPCCVFCVSVCGVFLG